MVAVVNALPVVVELLNKATPGVVVLSLDCVNETVDMVIGRLIVPEDGGIVVVVVILIELTELMFRLFGDVIGAVK